MTASEDLVRREEVASAALEVELTAESDRYRAEDSRWREQVAQLHRSLRQEGAAVRVLSARTAGTKGDVVVAVILALGSSGVFTAAVEIFRAWLARDRTRSLSILVRDGDSRKHLVIRGSDVDREGFRELTSLAIRHGFRE